MHNESINTLVSRDGGAPGSGGAYNTVRLRVSRSELDQFAGDKGGGPGAYTIRAQMPDVQNLQRNSRVRVNDVTVGNVTDIELQGWNALVTMTIDGDVDLPANATATLGQTSLLGSVHVELAPPAGIAPQGKLTNGSLIPLSSAGAYPSTERTLAAVSLLLNGGGLGQIQDITKTLSTAFSGREQDLRNLLNQLDTFVGYLNDQRATSSPQWTTSTVSSGNLPIRNRLLTRR